MCHSLSLLLPSHRGYKKTAQVLLVCDVWKVGYKPGRLQYFYNSNIPIIYLGRGAPKKFLEDNNAGLVINEGSGPIEVLEKMQEPRGEGV